MYIYFLVQISRVLQAFSLPYPVNLLFLFVSFLFFVGACMFFVELENGRNSGKSIYTVRTR